MLNDGIPVALPTDKAEHVTAMVWHMARAYAPCPVDDVEDIIHETLWRLLMKQRKNLSEVESGGVLRAWIRRVYMNVLRAHIRKQRTTSRRGCRSLVAIGAEADGDDNHQESFDCGVTNPIEEVTTEDAAGFLRVSRPYLVKLIDTGVLRARKVGRYRRIAVSDLVAYREKMFRQADVTCRDLTKLAQAEESARRLHGKEDASD